MQVILTHAGPYGVTHIPCPQYTGPANMNTARQGVLHCTEGGWLGSLSVFKKHWAPHFLIDSKRIAQLIPIGMAGAALKAHNNEAFIQIELVGFSNENLWLPDEESCNHLAAVMATCDKMFGIPLRRYWEDDDYGKAGDNPHRHAGLWGKIPGWYSHGDAPLPDTHWDCGALCYSKLFELAKTFEPQPQEPTGATGHP